MSLIACHDCDLIHWFGHVPEGSAVSTESQQLRACLQSLSRGTQILGQVKQVNDINKIKGDQQ